MIRWIALRTIIFAALLAALLAPPALGAPTSADSGRDTAGTPKRKTVKPKRKTSKPKTVRKPVRRAAPRPPPAQATLLQRGTIGVRLGFTSAWAEDDFSSEAAQSDYSTELGAVAGVTYDKAINQFLHYRTGLQYHGRGFSTEVAGRTTTASLGYVEIPLEGGVHFQAARTVTPYINVGGYLGLKIKTEVRTGGEKDKSAEDNFAAVDYGLNLSLGAWFPMGGAVAASAGLTYSHGFADVIDHDQTKSSEDDQTFNRAFYITGAVHF